MTNDAQTRVESALTYHNQGYNCAQSVLMALADRLGITPDQAAAFTTGLGGGVGGQGEICGVVTAMSIAQSLADSHDPADKAKVYARVRELSIRFKERTEGRLRCADLKKAPQTRSCNSLIADGVEIMLEALDNPQ